jgi:hypothetical protein
VSGTGRVGGRGCWVCVLGGWGWGWGGVGWEKVVDTGASLWHLPCQLSPSACSYWSPIHRTSCSRFHPADSAALAIALLHYHLPVAC